MKNAFAVALCLFAGPAFPQSAPCLESALRDYTRTNLALLTQSFPIMTVEAVIAQRRLQEGYCVRVAICRVGQPSTPALAIAYAAMFSACLRDEAAEQNK